MIPVDIAHNWFIHLGHRRAVRIAEYRGEKRVGFGSGLMIDRPFRIAVIIAWQPAVDSTIRLGDIVACVPASHVDRGRFRIVGEPLRIQSAIARSN